MSASGSSDETSPREFGTLILDYHLQQSPFVGCFDECGRRKWLIRGFPYLIIYELKGSSLHILAIAHTSREPNYWETRDQGGQ